MKISVLGAGYVGLTIACGFASLGNEVTLVDIDQEKVRKINHGVLPIHEEGLENLLMEFGHSIRATGSFDSIKNSEITFIAVGTPAKENGKIDLRYIISSSRKIGEVLRKKTEYHLVALKSTVTPETTEKVVIPLLEKYSGKKAGESFGVCMNPEFLREGTALRDFLNPSRIVIGEYDEKSGKKLKELYKNFKCKILRTELKLAELIKYATNAFLALKISYANEMGNICKKLGIDVYKLMEGVALDERISGKFLSAGCGFGGSCFPKDCKALLGKAKELGYESNLLQEALNLNERQKIKPLEILEEKISVKGKKIAVLGISFKPGTDDIREAPSLVTIHKLLEKGASVFAYDPKVNYWVMRKLFPQVKFCSSASEALSSADAGLLMTEWDEFKNLEAKKMLIEGRKMYIGEGVCW